MTRFAFIIHPLSAKDVSRKYPIAKYFPEGAVEAFIRLKKPMILSKITGIESLTGAKTEGWFIACPLTPRQMTKTVPLDEVYDKIVQCAEITAREGAQLIGLGAFTSVVGDGGITIAKRSPIPVTTGNSYTVATAIEGTRKACEELGIDLSKATLAVVGAAGSIGKTCARVLSKEFGRTILIGRDLEKVKQFAEEIPGAVATTSIDQLREADAIITVTSSESDVIMPDHLKPGAVVCDVARPRDVSVRVSKERPDVLVIEGGVVQVPGNVEFNFRFGFPDGMAYACMSETMMLALEDRPESFTLGKDVSVQQVEETTAMAHKHGFKLAGFRAFERAVDKGDIERARAARASAALKQPAYK